MSTLVLQSLARAGLAPVLEARREGNLARVRALSRALETADLLAVGALADLIRAEEVGDVVRIFANTHAAAGADVVFVPLPDGNDPKRSGFAMLRKVAIARIAGPHAARVRIDWSESGLEVAQVALGFGASELVGPLANRRGLPIADDAVRKVKGQGMVEIQALKRKELGTLLAFAGRRAVFEPSSHDSSETPEAASHV